MINEVDVDGSGYLEFPEFWYITFLLSAIYPNIDIHYIYNILVNRGPALPREKFNPFFVKESFFSTNLFRL